jgi:Na+-translocating ferredoxin:NAD+ oxidoreductase RnfG subunit
MDWTQIILAVIALIAAVVTGLLIPLMQEKIGAERLEKMNYWLKVLIAAAETAFPDRGMGGKKSEWVMLALQKLGLGFDAGIVRDAITGLCRKLTADGVINNGY